MLDTCSISIGKERTVGGLICIERLPQEQALGLGQSSPTSSAISVVNLCLYFNICVDLSHYIMKIVSFYLLLPIVFIYNFRKLSL